MIINCVVEVIKCDIISWWIMIMKWKDCYTLHFSNLSKIDGLKFFNLFFPSAKITCFHRLWLWCLQFPTQISRLLHHFQTYVNFFLLKINFFHNQSQNSKICCCHNQEGDEALVWVKWLKKSAKACTLEYCLVGESNMKFSSISNRQVLRNMKPNIW